MVSQQANFSPVSGPCFLCLWCSGPLNLRGKSGHPIILCLHQSLYIVIRCPSPWDDSSTMSGTQTLRVSMNTMSFTVSRWEVILWMNNCILQRRETLHKLGAHGTCNAHCLLHPSHLPPHNYKLILGPHTLNTPASFALTCNHLLITSPTESKCSACHSQVKTEQWWSCAPTPSLSSYKLERRLGHADKSAVAQNVWKNE